MGCVVCRNLGEGWQPAAIHHIRDGQGLGRRAPEGLVIPLCAGHHQDGGHGVAIHAGKRVWEALYGSELDLLSQTVVEVFTND